MAAGSTRSPAWLAANGCHPRASQRRDPGTHLVDTVAGLGRGLDRANIGIDVAKVGVEQLKIEVEVGEQIDLVDDHDIGGPEHHRVLQRLLLALGHREHHRPGVLADIELGRAHEVADVLDHDEVEIGKGQARQGRANHRGVEMAFAAEAVRGVDQRHRCAESCETIGIDRRLDIALDDADPNRGSRGAAAPRGAAWSCLRPATT